MSGPVLRLVWDDGADRDMALPSYESAGAAGADLRANLPPDHRSAGLVLEPMQRRIVPTGLRVEIPRGFEAQIRPRSGLALKHGLTLVNTPGTIDSDYRGPLGVLMINLGSDPFTVAHGDRIAQMIVAPVVQARFELAGALGDTARGAGGFGIHRARLMVLFAVLAIGLWFLGSALDAPARVRWLMIGLLYVAVLMALVLLPAGHPMRGTLGGSLGEWLVLGGLAALVLGYKDILGRLRRRAIPVAAQPAGLFRPTELERYARHVIMREIGGLGQKKLKEARVLVVGAGGLGSPSLLYLAAAGVGTIGVIDDDVVENTNLQRQVIHSDARLGMPKVFSAEFAMKAVNPFVTVLPYHRKLVAGIAQALIADYDIVLDGTDNFDTRYMVNEACVAAGRPLVSAAITQWEGQISVFDPGQGAPCYRCVFPEAPAPGLAPSCAEAGVSGPLPGVLGSMMAVECIKAITGAGETLRGRMMIYDALYAQTRTISVKRREGCETCGG